MKRHTLASSLQIYFMDANFEFWEKVCSCVNSTNRWILVMYIVMYLLHVCTKHFLNWQGAYRFMWVCVFLGLLTQLVICPRTIADHFSALSDSAWTLRIFSPPFWSLAAFLDFVVYNRIFILIFLKKFVKAYVLGFFMLHIYHLSLFRTLKRS